MLRCSIERVLVKWVDTTVLDVKMFMRHIFLSFRDEDGDKDEALIPKHTFNPHFQRVYQVLSFLYPFSFIYVYVISLTCQTCEGHND